MPVGVSSVETSGKLAARPSWADSLFLFALSLLLLSTAVATYRCWIDMGRYFTGTDDANIVFVYARNFAHGHGIVYNIGGEHVEGFSSPLYMLVCSLFYLISPTPEKGIFAFNFVVYLIGNAAVLYLIHRIALKAGASTPQRLILLVAYSVWLCLDPGLITWAIVSLMDSGIFIAVLAITFSVLCLQALEQQTPSPARRAAFALLIALLVLARSEGPGWAILALLAQCALRYRQTSSARGALQETAPAIAAFLVVFVSLTGFRLWYFGYPVSNPYYVKVSETRRQTLLDGIGYFRSFVKIFRGFVVLADLGLLLVIATQWLRKKTADPLFFVTVVVAAFASTGLLIPILEGGDHFAVFRMYQHTYPILTVAVLLLFVLAIPRLNRPVPLLLATLVLLGAPLLSGSTWRRFNAANLCLVNGEPCPTGPDTLLIVSYDWGLAMDGRHNGQILREMFDPFGRPTTGVIAAGGNAYGLQGTTYDLMGLNYARMAHADKIKTGPKGHQAFNKGVFYATMPQIVLPECPAKFPTEADLQQKVDDNRATVNSFYNYAMKNIFNDPAFRANYVMASVQQTIPGHACYGYFRRDFLKTLQDSNQFQITTTE